MQATVQTSLKYVAPGNVSATINISQTLAYVASNVGFLDVPEGTLAAVEFEVPLGSIAALKGVLVQNNTDQDLDLSINGSGDTFTLPPGGLFLVTGAAESGITSVSLTTTDAVAADGSIAYATIGDTATP